MTTGPLAPVTGLAKGGAAFLATLGVLITLIGALLALIGAVGGDTFSALTEDPSVGSIIGGAFVVFGGIFIVIGILHLLAAVGSWRGSNGARILGIILAVPLGLLQIGTAAAASSSGTGGSVISWVVAAGYIYTAIVLAFFWRAKRA
jgi:hypothetical protein